MPPNSAQRAAVNKILLGFFRVMRANGVGQATAMIRIAMADADGQPWPIATLADFTGCDRKTVRAYLRKQLEAGAVERVAGGWRLTQLGVDQSASRFAAAWGDVDQDARALISRIAQPG